MGESDNQENDFFKIVAAIFKEDIEEAVKKVYKSRIEPTIRKTTSDSLKDLVDLLCHTTSTVPSVVPASSVKPGQQATNYGKISTAAVMSSSNAAALPSGTIKPVTLKTQFNGFSKFVVLSSYDDAQNVVNYMNDKIREEGEASVNDFFDCAGKSKAIEGNPIATKYGWYNIDASTITQMADGQWMLSMPDYEYLAKKEN